MQNFVLKGKRENNKEVKHKGKAINQLLDRKKKQFKFSIHVCVCVIVHELYRNAQISLHFQGLSLGILMSWHTEKLERGMLHPPLPPPLSPSLTHSLTLSRESEQNRTILHTDCSYSNWL